MVKSLAVLNYALCHEDERQSGGTELCIQACALAALCWEINAAVTE
jgi:hypothetical protein